MGNGRELMKMKFGKNGPLVTRLGFGAIPIQTVSHDEAVRVARYAYESGIRFFDTARAYTTSEERLGVALSDVRRDVFIATKSGARDTAKISSDFDRSLNNLRTDYVDLFMFHNVMRQSDLDKIMAPDGPFSYIKRQQQMGRVRLIGISSHSVDGSLLAVRQGAFASLEFPLNYLETQSLPELLPLVKQMGMGFIVMKPFAGGALSSATAALKWVYSRNIEVVIPGMMSLEQVDVAVRAAREVEDVLGESSVPVSTDELCEPPLTDEERAAIETDLKHLAHKFCRRCQYCLPCPQGISVNFIVSAERLFNRSGWQRAGEWMGSLTKALECVGCGACEARCPYQLPLASMVKPTAQALIEKIQAVRCK